MSRRQYEVLATVGAGGMGSVYRARLRGAGDFEKEVALKVLNAEGVEDPEDVARRLRDEARILGLIRHRAVVHVDGLVRLGGNWTVVMEFVDGVDVHQVIELIGAIPVGCALEIVSEVASALHVAWHAQGPDGRELHLLHRDIKPANVRLTPVGEVKVLDFGVARADFDNREAQTQQGGFGSLGYVPQERIDGVDVPAGDVYSLGAVLYEMLSAEKFGQMHLVQKKHDERLDEKLEKLVERGIPKPVRELVRSMMAFEPEQRPTAREIERQTQKLRSEVPGVRLRDWAEQRIPELVERVRDTLSGAGITGEFLIEDADPTPPGADRAEPALPAIPAASAPARRTVPVVLLGLVGLLVVGALVLAALVGGLLLGLAF